MSRRLFRSFSSTDNEFINQNNIDNIPDNSSNNTISYNLNMDNNSEVESNNNEKCGNTPQLATVNPNPAMGYDKDYMQEIKGNYDNIEKCINFRNYKSFEAIDIRSEKYKNFSMKSSP